MGKISSELLQPLKSVLKKCDDVFSERQDLWNIFSDERLYIWQERLPEATDLGRRIERTIYYLKDKENSRGENALTLLLSVLSERYLAQDERHHLLVSLIDRMQSVTVTPRSQPALPGIRSNDQSTILSEEANPLQVSMTYISELDQINQCARSVSLIKARRFRDGKRESIETGTGVLIAPGLLLTCWHVVAALAYMGEPPPAESDQTLQVKHMLLFFNHREIGKRCTCYKIKKLEYPLNGNAEQDFAVLRLEERDNQPYMQFGYLPIELDPPMTEETQLCIIQHPLGQPQQIVNGYYVDQSLTKERICYTTPTERGTSGAPVFSRSNWHVVAIHNGENNRVQLREGTRIKYIFGELKEKKADLYEEIMDAQRALQFRPPSESLTSSFNSSTVASMLPPRISSPSLEPAKQDAGVQRIMPVYPQEGIDTLPETSIQNMLTESHRLVLPQAKSAMPELILDEYRRKIASYRPKIRQIRKIMSTKTALYSDECYFLLTYIQSLRKPVEEMEKFTTRKLSKFYPGRIAITTSLHHLQALLTDLSELLINFCPYCQDAELEDRKEIIKKVDQISNALTLEKSGRRFGLWPHR